MPIVIPDPTNPVDTPQPSPTVIAAPEYKGIVVDSTYTPEASLMTSIEGSPWTVEYYSQVLDADNALAGQNVTRDPIYQSYRRIRQFVLKVTAPLTTSQDDATKTMAVTGGANVYSCLIPNEGDMFLADIGDGRAGVFRVTHSERKTIFKEACYSIEYVLIDYATDQRRNDLTSKVVKKLQFVKDFMLHGQNPIIEEDEYATIRKLAGQYYDLVDLYFRMFTSVEYGTLLIPGQPEPTYDPFLTKAVMAFFTGRDSQRSRDVRVLNCDDQGVEQSSNFWEVILKRDRKLLKFSPTKAGLVGSLTFTSEPLFDGIYHSGISYVVHPKDPFLSVDNLYRNENKPLAAQVLIDPSANNLTASAAVNDLSGFYADLPWPEAPSIKPVLVDEYYVFSEAFYRNDDPGQSKLELCVQSYLEGKALDTQLLFRLCEDSYNWGWLERFYYLPILLVLIRANIRSF